MARTAFFHVRWDGVAMGRGRGGGVGAGSCCSGVEGLAVVGDLAAVTTAPGVAVAFAIEKDATGS